MLNDFAGLLGLSIGLGLTLLVALVMIGVFEVWMFVHAILNEHISSDRKILWLIGMVLLHPIVAIAYFFTDYKAV